MRSFHVLLATALMTFTAACSATPQGADGSDSTQSDLSSSSKVKLTQADDGTTVTVKPNADVTLTLPENGSTGYTWMIKKNDLGAPTRNDVGGSPSRPGSSGHVTFTWSTAGASGRVAIELELQRPWAETTPAIDHFSVTLDIHGGSSGGECGGFMGKTCANPSEYCAYDAKCGEADGSGTCRPKPHVCPMFVSPVCGCDGQTYSNGCVANEHGTTVMAEGPCPATN